MKQLVSIFSIAAVMTACSHPRTGIDSFVVSPSGEKPATTIDTTGLAQFQAWKAQHELANVSAYQPAAQSVATAPKKTYTAAHKTAKSRTATSTSRSGTNASGTMTSESGNTAKAPVKKGWSKAAKGAAIGGGSGAVIGAVVNKKNRAVGAVIGGVVGGGVGYGIGRSMDKKDGRY